MPELYLERCGRFVLLPVIHHSFEFALAARSAFEQVKPVAVGLEYPSSLQRLLQQGDCPAARISVLIYGNPKKYIRIEPVDAFVEAARLAMAGGLEMRCIDSSAGYPEVYDPVPDTFAMRRLGHLRYCRLLLEKGAAAPAGRG